MDDQLRVLVNGAPVPHLWAVGDVTGKMMLAHTAAAQGTVAVDNILGQPRTIDYRSIPAATFTHPEISSVGLSEADAKELAGVKIEIRRRLPNDQRSRRIAGCAAARPSFLGK